MLQSAERMTSLEVSCPRCDAATRGRVPASYGTPTASARVALYGARTPMRCENGHPFYVYDC